MVVLNENKFHGFENFFVWLSKSFGNFLEEFVKSPCTIYIALVLHSYCIDVAVILHACCISVAFILH